uniref:Uncharacterized protein n=1 Tax=Daphnia galeata TaxID=27404 RepID=A0A8J2RCC0_9CRUS|nr:unnamed protein product [Daphnia galeata]
MVRNMGQMEVNNAEDVYDWQSLIESMPTRLARVLESNGDMNKYFTMNKFNGTCTLRIFKVA